MWREGLKGSEHKFQKEHFSYMVCVLTTGPQHTPEKNIFNLKYLQSVASVLTCICQRMIRTCFLWDKKNNNSQKAFKLSQDTKTLQWNQNHVSFKLWSRICLIVFLLSSFSCGSSEHKTKSCWNFYLADEYTYYIPPPTHSCMHIYTQTHTGYRNSQMCRCERCEPRAIKTRQNPRWLCVSSVPFFPLHTASFYFLQLHDSMRPYSARPLLSVCRVHFLSKHGQSVWEPWSLTDKIRDKPVLSLRKVWNRKQEIHPRGIR